MIAYAASLAAGTSARLIIIPHSGTEQVRLLRKLADTWSDFDDGEAFVVADEIEVGSRLTIFDSRNLDNHTVYFYKAYYRIGSNWTSSASISLTPATTFDIHGDCILMLLRERLDKTLASLIERGDFPVRSGRLPVYLEPPAFDDVEFPLITLHLDNNSSGERVDPVRDVNVSII